MATHCKTFCLRVGKLEGMAGRLEYLKRAVLPATGVCQSGVDDFDWTFSTKCKNTQLYSLFIVYGRVAGTYVARFFVLAVHRPSTCANRTTTLNPEVGCELVKSSTRPAVESIIYRKLERNRRT